MSIKILFRGRVSNGRLQLANKAGFIKAIQSMNGKDVEISVSTKSTGRTGNQNRYYWGVLIDVIATETGNDPETVHEALKAMFLSTVPVTMANNTVNCMPSTTRLNTAEFNNYIEKIITWGAENDILLPYPNEATI